MPEILDRFYIERNPATVCAQAEAERREYKMVLDRDQRCVWFYDLTDKSPGSTVHVHDPQDEKSDGYGGRVITFKIGKTAEYLAKGPWHSNSDALFECTGVDLRDKHLTFGCIAKYRGYETGGRTYLEGILYIDKEPTLGTFGRIREMAKKMATEAGHPIAYHSESSGGSSNGYEVPEGTDWRSWDGWFKTQLPQPVASSL